MTIPVRTGRRVGRYLAVDSTIGHRVALARRRQGLTQAELATRTDISPKIINHLENGRQTVATERLMVIARTLQVDMNYLCGFSADAPLSP